MKKSKSFRLDEQVIRDNIVVAETLGCTETDAVELAIRLVYNLVWAKRNCDGDSVRLSSAVNLAVDDIIKRHCKVKMKI